MNPVLISAFTATSCLGRGLQPTWQALQAQRGGLQPTVLGGGFATCTGAVAGLEDVLLPPAWRRFDCRNNRLAYLALHQDGMLEAVRGSAARWGAQRVGVLLGTSTSGIRETEQAFRHLDPVSGMLPGSFDYEATQSAFSVVEFVRKLAGIAGPAAVVCTACSSSAKVFGAAQRMIAAGLIDAALVGGIDTLCLTTLHGFRSLQLVSATPCRPFDVGRDGISIGEAGAFALLERVPESLDADAVLLAGVGESSDAYHMSSPHPQGLGAQAAMRSALAAASLQPADIDYLNLHGTGTRGNDQTESAAVAAVFPAGLCCSSTKGATGHTLGAAGGLEAVICTLALRRGLMPAGINTLEPEPAVAGGYLLGNVVRPISRVLSNSFGFGGANCTLALVRAH